MGRGIVFLCRLTTRTVVINLTTIGLTLAGLVLFGLFPAIAAAHAASARPTTDPIPKLARLMVAVWRREIVRLNAVALPLVAFGVVAALAARGVEAPLLRAAALALLLAGVSGAVCAAALAGGGAGTVLALWRDLGRLWLARPWVPPALALLWLGAFLSPLIHPLLALYLAAALAAGIGARLTRSAEETPTVPAPIPPLGQGV